MICGRFLRGAAIVLAASLTFVQPAKAVLAPPFFLYGASFFYERIPRAQWAGALARYREAGVNTIDLYVMWNWHEVRDGDFDFDGRTNPRRDLAGLLRLIHDDGFHVVLRPGPVIRNEWRNGGYPAWLLTRPEYRMPLRDVLEGRYPATATLQNAHSDAAAAQWLHNATHMRYAKRWLDHVFRVAAPWKSDIVAVALDDDQGAYLDNETWPGPNFHRYIAWLASIARRDLGPGVPAFINTFEMKVTASAPAWAWGNWYQSDAYSIGEHDRSQLEFSAGLLQTQSPAKPILMSEFQAGWLQDADQAMPRAADPSNTTLALHTLLQMGAHGVVNFPLQDTLNPSGWEAPWSNAFYSWDAAFSVDLQKQSRFAPTARFGMLMQRYGDAVIRTHPRADAAVAYLAAAFPASSLDAGRIAQVAQATMDAQRGCRIMRITCALVDVRYASDEQLQRFRTLIVPQTGVAEPFVAAVRQRLVAFGARGGRIVASARSAKIAAPAAGGIPNAVLLASDDGRIAFLDVVNYGRSAQHAGATYVHAGATRYEVAPFTVPARDAALIPLTNAFIGANSHAELSRSASAGGLPPKPTPFLPLRADASIAAPLREVPPRTAAAYAADVYGDGYPAVVLENDALRLIVSPCSGARALIFEDKATGSNLFTTIGGLRDAWWPQLPPSARDYIAKYTHPIPAGTFNRCYAYRTGQRNSVAYATFAYTAPDAPDYGAAFHRTIVLRPDDAQFEIISSGQFRGSSGERALQISSVALSPSSQVLRVAQGYGIFDAQRGRVTLVAWNSGGVEAHAIARHPGDALITIVLRPGTQCRVYYGLAAAASESQAQARLRAFANRRPSSRSAGEVAER